jgi:hypothetical protein
MKTLLFLLLTCLPLWAATTYTVLSDNTNRTITGGTTNLSLLNATNQVFTGTNTFPAASFYPANNIGSRTLFTTNVFVSSVPAYTATTPTNNGNYSLLTGIFEETMPALLSTNSRVLFNITVERTNANAAVCNLYWFVGSNTNWVSGAANNISTTVGKQSPTPANSIFENFGSLTTQIQSQAGTAAIWGPTSLVNTSVPWKIYFALQTATEATNIFIRSVTIIEQVQ